MPGETDPLRRELWMLIRRAFLLDAAAVLIAVMMKAPVAPFALGLALGTACLAVSLMLLRLSILKMAEDAKRAGVTNQRRSILFYMLRLLAFSLAFGVAVVYRQHISPLGTAIPIFYPRLIYTADALFRRNSRPAVPRHGDTEAAAENRSDGSKRKR